VPKVLSDEDVDAFRARICAAAERLFAEHGPNAVNMRQLAAELGVSAMTPYRYFKDKDAILAAVRAQGFDRFAEALEGAFAARDEPNAQAAAVAGAYIGFALDNPAAYRLMFDLTQPNEAHYPDLVRAAARAKLTMRAYIDRLMAASLIEDGDPEIIAHAHWAAIHGLVVLQLAGKLSPPVGFEAVRANLMGALARGYRRQPA
jgi:AcrR family transcriptional regulator